MNCFHCQSVGVCSGKKSQGDVVVVVVVVDDGGGDGVGDTLRRK